MNRVEVMTGNEAVAEGALAAGVRFFAGYPISPSSEIAQVMARRLPALGGTFLQMEDEIGSLAAVVGASLTGVRAMDATSGPGFSLKMENLGMAVMMEVPLVLVDVMRVGPSTGSATLPAQADLMQARWGSHGGPMSVTLVPWSVQECFDLTARAVDLSERLRVPALVLSDAHLGWGHERVELRDSVPVGERPKPTTGPAGYRPYAPGPDLVPPFAPYGSGYRWFANSSVHTETAREATSNNAAIKALVERLQAKVEQNEALVQDWVEDVVEEDAVVVVAVGTAARTALAAVRRARVEGLRAGLLRPRTLWPFPARAIRAAAEKARAIVVAELNLGQLIGPVREAVAGACPVHTVNRWDGRLLEPAQVLQAVRKANG